MNGIAKPENSSFSTMVTCSVMPGCSENDQSNDDQALIGSLVDSHPFKEDGLVKKTISIIHKGIPHHLVSYYSVHDVKKQQLGDLPSGPAAL